VAKRYRKSHDPKRKCEVCGLTYGRFMAGQFGRGDKAHQASVGDLKESLWAQHVEQCGEPEIELDRALPKVAQAADVIEHCLGLGACSAARVLDMATDAGIGKRNLYEAKKLAGVRSYKTGEGWIWELEKERVPF